jgi:phosphoadenosine phosphosulfate reductase
LNAKASPTFDAKLAETQALLAQAATAFGTNAVTQASSLGAEDVVITHLINSLQLDLPIFVLETGKLHAETLQLLEQTVQSSRVPVTVYRPKNEAVIEFVKREGDEPMYKSIELRKACCGIRQMEPLARALDGKKGWVTGLRREQSGARAEVPLTDESELATTGRVKYNPLHDQFFPSIGCAPCTSAISLGEDFRAGRWWWEDENAKECGLHVKAESTELPAVSSLSERTPA